MINITELAIRWHKLATDAKEMGIATIPVDPDNMLALVDALKIKPETGWIPVDHLLPKKGERVMAFIEFESEIVTPLIKEAEYTGSTFRIGPNTIGITGMPKATHWLPLSALPPLEKKR